MWNEIKKELNRLEQRSNIKKNSLTVAGPQACAVLEDIKDNTPNNQGEIILNYLQSLNSLVVSDNKNISWTGNIYNNRYIQTPYITLKDWEGKNFYFYFFNPFPKQSWEGYDERMKSLHET